MIPYLIYLSYTYPLAFAIAGLAAVMLVIVGFIKFCGWLGERRIIREDRIFADGVHFARAQQRESAYQQNKDPRGPQTQLEMIYKIVPLAPNQTIVQAVGELVTRNTLLTADLEYAKKQVLAWVDKFNEILLERDMAFSHLQKRTQRAIAARAKTPRKRKR